MNKDKDVRFVIRDENEHSASFVYIPPNYEGPLAVNNIPNDAPKHDSWVKDSWIVNLKKTE